MGRIPVMSLIKIPEMSFIKIAIENQATVAQLVERRTHSVVCPIILWYPGSNPASAVYIKIVSTYIYELGDG
jgi:hypothetical protein